MKWRKKASKLEWRPLADPRKKYGRRDAPQNFSKIEFKIIHIIIGGFWKRFFIDFEAFGRPIIHGSLRSKLFKNQIKNQQT